MKKGLIFDLKKFAIHDGPGIRTTIFFKGCPLRCWWCHNPEGQAPHPELMFHERRCSRCGDCLKVCKEDVLSLANGSLIIDRERCTLCGACAKACHHEALEMSGREVTVAQMMMEIEKDGLFYDESGGGVTFSGGEPLMQPDFLYGLLRACKEEGIHTALDTTGFASWEILDKISDYVCLFLYDLKLMDDQRHRKFTGVSNELILRNLRALSLRGRPIVARLPLIPGINDDGENIRRLGEFVASLPEPCPVDILPYHKAGIAKYVKLDRAYRLLKTQPPAGERMAKTAQILVGFGLQVAIGGEPYGRK